MENEQVEPLREGHPVHATPASDDESPLQMAARGVCTAADRSTYEARLTTLLAEMRNKRYSTESLTRLLRAVTLDLAPPRFESRAALLSTLMAGLQDEEPVARFLLSMVNRPEMVRPLLARHHQRANPFPLLARLLAANLPFDFRNFLEDQLTDAARQKSGTLAQWAVNSRGLFLRREVFEVLLRRAPDTLGAAGRAILQEGIEEERAWLLERLVKEGTGVALRLLALGLSWGSQPRSVPLIRAIGKFQDPIAVGLLAEAVHRVNLAGGEPEEAEAALESLARMKCEESRRHLRAIARSRVLGLPVYRRSLRRMAGRALALRETG